MKLELLSLRAVNCGPLRDVRIDFTDGQGHARPITLLAGANGSGKTTVLELIAALMSLLLTVPSKEEQFSARFYELPKAAQFLAKCDFAIIKFLIDGESLSLFYGNKPDDELLSGDYYGWIKNKPVGYRSSFEGRFYRDVYYSIASGEFETVDFNGGTASNSASLRPFIFYMPHYRAISKLNGTELSQELTRYEWLYRYSPATEFKGSLEAYFIWLEYAEPDVFQSIREVVGALFPTKKSISIDRKRLKVVVNLADGGKHDLDELSSGEQNLLTMLIDLRRRLTPGSIVLIDEIENSLHPAFQHRIAQGLLQIQREVPFQLIATSHAEAFIDVFGTAATRILPMTNFAIK